MFRLSFTILLTLFYFNIQAQDILISGVVWGKDIDGKKEVLIGANIRWLNTQMGTISSDKGFFQLKKNDFSDSLVVSYIGFQTDTFSLGDATYFEIVLEKGIRLASTEIVHRQKSTIVSHSATLHSENLGQGELSKAACCNLSESFETSPSVDVSFSDAITGTRQIRMLGLAGPYSQLTRENMPDVRGLAAVNGMEFIPGTWIDGIQLIKGAGSVVNGYESIAGQINTELQRSANMPDFFLNFYLNNDRQFESNIQFKHKLAPRWQNGIFIHAKYSDFLRDMNEDGFADKPANKRVVFMDRLEWINDKNIHFELGSRLIYHHLLGGQISFQENQIMDSLHPWGMVSVIKKADFWMKLGRVSQLKPWNSTAVQMMVNIFDQEARYGLNQYFGNQKTVYLNFIQMGRLSNEKHEYKTGLSFLYDDYNEVLNQHSYLRTEIVPGVYGEYLFKPNHRFAINNGLRVDYHNNYGVFLTPRVHVRLELTEKTILRLSAGRGFRTANIFSEHFSMLATSREIIIHGDSSGYGFGLKPEIAWNYGLNLTQTFEIAYREAVFGLSFYRTDFSNQIIFDIDKDLTSVHFYNLLGVSYANSLQLQFDYELFRRFDLRLAYRFYDVKTSYSTQLLQAPLLASHRGFVNLGYKTKTLWKFDFTFNWVGKKRIPIQMNTTNLITFSPIYILLNAQISKTYHENLDLYIGVENITNFIQENPIILADNPFSQGFDASLIWGPIWGQHVYAGVRWKWKKTDN
jgi:outer membrane receptor for ferrienterochelin and colicins